MQGRIFAGLFLCSLFIVAGGDAQSPDTKGKPVWTLEFIKVRSDNFGLAMAYLDDHWMRVRAEAKRQGAVLDYHRIQNAVLETPGHKIGDPSSIVLLTEYKNMDAYWENRTALSLDLHDLAGEGRPHPLTNGQGFIFRAVPPLGDLFETLYTQVFEEEPEMSTGLKLLAKQ